MIDFRYHIVSLVAVFLALALGLFLGSTTLQSTVTHNLRQQADSVIARNHRLQAANDAAKAELDQAHSFAAAVEPYAVAGKLDGATVAVVSAPGVDDDARDDLLSTLRTSGATVTADVRMAVGFLDASQDATWGQLAVQVSGRHPVSKGSGVEQASAALAKVLVTRPSARLPSTRRMETVLSTFSDGKLISVAGQTPLRPADLAILLVPLGSVPDDSPVAVTRNTDLIELAGALRHSSTGLVVAGPTIGDASNGGALVAIRGDDALAATVSTVDSDDTATGRIATVLALAAAPEGSVGSYGVAQDPPLPTQSAGP